jgi:hypothetical protein
MKHPAGHTPPTEKSSTLSLVRRTMAPLRAPVHSRRCTQSLQPACWQLRRYSAVSGSQLNRYT